MASLNVFIGSCAFEVFSKATLRSFYCRFAFVQAASRRLAGHFNNVLGPNDSSGRYSKQSRSRVGPDLFHSPQIRSESPAHSPINTTGTMKLSMAPPKEDTLLGGTPDADDDGDQSLELNEFTEFRQSSSRTLGSSSRHSQGSFASSNWSNSLHSSSARVINTVTRSVHNAIRRPNQRTICVRANLEGESQSPKKYTELLDSFAEFSIAHNDISPATVSEHTRSPNSSESVEDFNEESSDSDDEYGNEPQLILSRSRSKDLGFGAMWVNELAGHCVQLKLPSIQTLALQEPRPYQTSQGAHNNDSSIDHHDGHNAELTHQTLRAPQVVDARYRRSSLDHRTLEMPQPFDRHSRRSSVDHRSPALATSDTPRHISRVQHDMHPPEAFERQSRRRSLEYQNAPNDSFDSPRCGSLAHRSLHERHTLDRHCRRSTTEHHSMHTPKRFNDQSRWGTSEHENLYVPPIADHGLRHGSVEHLAESSPTKDCNHSGNLEYAASAFDESVAIQTIGSRAATDVLRFSRGKQMERRPPHTSPKRDIAPRPVTLNRSSHSPRHSCRYNSPRRRAIDPDTVRHRQIETLVNHRQRSPHASTYPKAGDSQLNASNQQANTAAANDANDMGQVERISPRRTSGSYIKRERVQFDFNPLDIKELSKSIHAKRKENMAPLKAHCTIQVPLIHITKPLVNENFALDMALREFEN
jgi:hypothetical protein